MGSKSMCFNTREVLMRTVPQLMRTSNVDDKHGKIGVTGNESAGHGHYIQIKDAAQGMPLTVDDIASYIIMSSRNSSLDRLPPHQPRRQRIWKILSVAQTAFDTSSRHVSIWLFMKTLMETICQHNRPDREANLRTNDGHFQDLLSREDTRYSW